jgi:hypothetical protein
MTPEETAAALQGVAENPVARIYQAGFAGGLAAAEAQYAMAGTAVAALAGLKEWIEERYAGFATGSLGSSDILREIDARLGKEAP